MIELSGESSLLSSNIHSFSTRRRLHGDTNKEGRSVYTPARPANVVSSLDRCVSKLDFK
jgi:hypothetical protein